ncbi:zinc finger bed domain-containing protein 4 [Holotrichia oblita]|uniref:Zinc finger bed domain-containing protein 4 n=1 Tax=Holotrichia oblita TaxID=644536 RepID=A0ACB9SL45_HOLOL|nr:zinc finger bed domain-containing protein 4 [Holotrichia oblita]
MKHFPESHTAQNIKECLEEIPTLWDIDVDKIHAIVRDNGRNVVKAIDDSVFTGVPCFIHTIQLAINAAMKMDSVAEILTKCRRIVSHFNHSGLAQTKLCALQKELSLPQHQLVQDVSTRWNSSYYMLSRLLEQKRVVSLYLTETTVNFENLSSTEWNILEKYIPLLKPFEEVTKIISSNFSSISEIIPHLKTLQKYLSHYIDENDQIMQLKVILENELKTRFERFGLEQNKLFTLATLLDPRYKLHFFQTDNVGTVKSQFLYEALKNSMSNDESDMDKDNLDNSQNDNNNDPESTIHRSFWQCYQELVTRRIENVDGSRSSAAHELHSYCAIPVIKRKDDPFEWWRQNYSRFPEMAHIAKRYLFCPASTVYSERLFLKLVIYMRLKETACFLIELKR